MEGEEWRGGAQVGESDLGGGGTAVPGNGAQGTGNGAQAAEG